MWGGGPCDFSVSPSPFGLDFGTLDFGTSDLGLTISSRSSSSPDEVTIGGAPRKELGVEACLLLRGPDMTILVLPPEISTIQRPVFRSRDQS